MAWAAAHPVIWGLGWSITSNVINDAERQRPNFGASGALVATAISGLLVVASARAKRLASRARSPATRSLRFSSSPLPCSPTGFAALASVFNDPDVLDEPSGVVLDRFRQHQGSVSLWSSLLAFSAATFLPIGYFLWVRWLLWMAMQLRRNSGQTDATDRRSPSLRADDPVSIRA